MGLEKFGHMEVLRGSVLVCEGCEPTLRLAANSHGARRVREACHNRLGKPGERDHQERTNGTARCFSR
jgi:hypothetical protein